jgi:hypothetical protein
MKKTRMKKTRKLGVRIAFREEGLMWNAYMALPDTMAGAKLLGSILMAPAARDPAIKEKFMEVMKQVLALAITDLTGQYPDEWYEKPAPEGERSGNA